jgi:hypothetical protein
MHKVLHEGLITVQIRNFNMQIRVDCLNVYYAVPTIDPPILARSA